MELWETLDLIASILIAITFPVWVKVLFDYLDRGESDLILQIFAVLVPLAGFIILGTAVDIQCSGHTEFCKVDPSPALWLAFLSAIASAIVLLFGAIWKLFK